jgi:hypothetical protein
MKRLLHLPLQALLSWRQTVQLVLPTNKHWIRPRVVHEMSRYFSLRTLLPKEEKSSNTAAVNVDSKGVILRVGIRTR